MKRMLAAGMILLSAVPAVMATPVILGDNNVIVQAINKVITYEVKSATMTEPVDNNSWGGGKISMLELILTAEGNVCPAKESDVAFVLNSSNPSDFRSPATLELLSYYKYPVDFGCGLYSSRTAVTVRIGIRASDSDNYDRVINIPLGYDGSDGVKKVTVSVKPHYIISVRLD